jgi:hypothetical protein
LYGFSRENWAILGGVCVRLGALWLAGGIGLGNFSKGLSWTVISYSFLWLTFGNYQSSVWVCFD